MYKYFCLYTINFEKKKKETNDYLNKILSYLYLNSIDSILCYNLYSRN